MFCGVYEVCFCEEVRLGVSVCLGSVLNCVMGFVFGWCMCEL